MIRFSGTDSFMLAMETPRAYMHTFKTAILDPSTDPDGWSFDKYRQMFLDRLHLIPYFRYRYLPSPLGINHPIWVDDPDFNIDYHIRRVALPEPGDHRALCKFMESVYAYQLDRSRPLWINWVVEGLEGGKVASVTLLHHAYVDGSGAAWALRKIYQEEPGLVPETVPEWKPDPLPSWGRRLFWDLRDLPGVLFKGLPKVVGGLLRKSAFERKQKRMGKPAHPTASMMRKTPLNRVLSPGRTYVCESLSLQDFKAVGKAFSVTLNDVFISCAAGVVRNYLLQQGYDADSHPLIAGTPFASKRPEGKEGMGNFTTLDFCWFPSHIADPLERLRASHDAAVEMKEHLKASVEAGADFSAVMELLLPLVIRAIRYSIHKQGGKVGFFGNLGLSNVPGPRNPLYLGNYKMENWYSMGPIVDGTTLNLTLWSYCEKVNLCLLADSKIVPDGWELFNNFATELKTLVALIPATPGLHGASQ